MRFVLLATFFLFIQQLAAQNITISARVQDNSSGEPLPYASVGIKGRSNGTITNLQGEFDFHFPSEFRNEILVISMLGYENFEAPVWSVLERDLSVIPLVSAATVLREVEVRDSLSGGEILRVALQKIPETFPMRPFLMEGFYRDVKQVGGTYISLLEAAVEIYDDNYSEPRNKSKLRERVKLLEVRKSLGYDNKFNVYFGQKNLLEDLLLHNNIRYRQIDMHDQLFANTHREEDSHYNGRSVFVVTNKTNFFLRVFIDKSDYAITHLQFQISGPNDQRKKNMVSKHISYEKTIDFKRYHDKMFLNYIKVTSREEWYDPADTVVKFETGLEQHLMINEVYAETDRRIGSTEKMRNYGLQYQDYPYNKPFWDNYNVLKETPIDRQILQDLERLAPLEKQFEDRY